MNSFLKWVGSKRQLLPEIRKYYPVKFDTYFEPFLGAANVLFDLKPKKAIINDVNWELINCYEQIRDNPQELRDCLRIFQSFDNEEYYYKIRNIDLTDDYKTKPNEWKAARTIYLNKTCFNGLYRVNKDGHFNVPYANHKNKFNFDRENILDIHYYLSRNDILIQNVDFELSVKCAHEYDFIYFDPVYYPLSDTSNFTSYTKDGFNKDDQIRLKNCFDDLTNRGCYCLLSNSHCDFILNLYKDYEIIEVKAKRNVNCDGNGRGKISEVLVKNYK